MSLLREIRFRLNGSPVRVSVPVTMSTLDLLREELGLTGTKYGCGEGECGACTILMDGVSVNACLMFAVDCEGRSITTIEGIAEDPANDELRHTMVRHGGVQCGFCTPGMVVQTKALLDGNPHPNRNEIQRGLEGNLCRCTGYKKIVDAVADLAGTTE
ncbi:MAG: (2Fe-2S)-binding protein [Proteobacteria bacterium]|nr:MAG: (2Fe-2S)-binding protein [Pseudomonadota bacterium]QKK11765.1 MAG: (2Fe-2S)-binding protein [Pseudomonadota bacterium]